MVTIYSSCSIESKASLQIYQHVEGTESTVTHTSQRAVLIEALAAGMVSVKAGRDIRSRSLQMASGRLPQRLIQPGGLVMGRTADLSSRSCMEKRVSQSLAKKESPEIAGLRVDPRVLTSE